MEHHIMKAKACDIHGLKVLGDIKEPGVIRSMRSFSCPQLRIDDIDKLIAIDTEGSKGLKVKPVQRRGSTTAVSSMKLPVIKLHKKK